MDGDTTAAPDGASDDQGDSDRSSADGCSVANSPDGCTLSNCPCCELNDGDSVVIVVVEITLEGASVINCEDTGLSDDLVGEIDGDDEPSKPIIEGISFKVNEEDGDEDEDSMAGS